MPKYYTGIGSRALPDHLSKPLTQAASFLEGQGYVLRSGGARGADMAFELGVTDVKNQEIYIPWAGFNKRYNPRQNNTDITVDIDDGANAKAVAMAAEHHPAWDKLSQPVKRLMVRNSCQLFGITMNKPSDFVLCWTPAGQMVGVTNQALRIAQANNIKIINFGSDSLPNIEKQLMEIIK